MVILIRDYIVSQMIIFFVSEEMFLTKAKVSCNKLFILSSKQLSIPIQEEESGENKIAGNEGEPDRCYYFC